MNNHDSETTGSRRAKSALDQNGQQGASNTREDADHLWDKTFTDNEDRSADGYLSRTQRRRQSEHNSMITTALVVAIIVLASVPLAFWLTHRESFNHPAEQRTEKVASSSSAKTHHQSKAVKKTKKKAKAHHKTKSKQSQRSKQEQLSASSSSSQTSASSSSSVSQSSATRTVTVEKGQGIYRVATNNGMTVSQLEQLNGLTPGSELHPGQQLKVK